MSWFKTLFSTQKVFSFNRNWVINLERTPTGPRGGVACVLRAGAFAAAAAARPFVSSKDLTVFTERRQFLLSFLRHLFVFIINYLLNNLYFSPPGVGWMAQRGWGSQIAL
jgi:hypothetical protein